MSNNICSRSVDSHELSSQQSKTLIKEADTRKDYLGADNGKYSTQNE